MRREWLDRTVEEFFDGDAGRGVGEEVAEHLLKVATVETDEQLDALPLGSVVRTDGDEVTTYDDGSWEKGGIAEKRLDIGGVEAWFFVGKSLGYRSHQANLTPGIVLYLGGPQ